MENIEDIIKWGIIALLPVYLKDRGNATKIILENHGDIYIENRIATVLKLIADHYTINLDSIRREYGRKIQSKNRVPIPLNREDVLIQIKVRKTYSKNDQSSGYFNLRYIDSMINKSGEIHIRTTNNREIKVLNQRRTIVKHIKDGRLIREIYRDKVKFPLGEAELNYKTPATKEDIAMVIREILDIKNQLLP